jgi:hypothetical protein
MHKNRLKLFFVGVIVLVIAGVAIGRMKHKKSNNEVVKEITPFVGSIKTFISSTATVLPKNRL